jgi:hypothetical protein
MLWLKSNRRSKMVRTVEEVEKAVAQLPQDQLRQFRDWYEKFDSEAWDEQIENDIAAGKLDSLAEVAISDHKAGKTKKL